MNLKTKNRVLRNSEKLKLQVLRNLVNIENLNVIISSHYGGMAFEILNEMKK